MHVVSVFNVKGGVGKSTLTVGMAEFLAQKHSVLVIDIDPNAATARSILGDAIMTEAVHNGRSVVDLAERIRRSGRPLKSADDFIVQRPAVTARGTALSQISVVAPDYRGHENVEEKISGPRNGRLFRRCLKPALDGQFDFVLIDVQGNSDRRHGLVVNGLIMSDFVLIPVEPSQISMATLPRTFEMIQNAQAISHEGRPEIIGLVGNKTDRRTQQYASNLRPFFQGSDEFQLPPVFDAYLGEHEDMKKATDSNQDFSSLKVRFGKYYDNVRRVSLELKRRCDDYAATAPAGRDRGRYGADLRKFLKSIWKR